MTSKENYLTKIKLLENSDIFITDETSLILKEIENNCIYISYPDLKKELPVVDEFYAIVEGIKQNRRTQLKRSNLQIGLIYYSWFDEQAGQYRINFINSNHLKLPFNCELEFVSDERVLIESFLESFKKPNLSWEDFEAESIDSEAPESNANNFALAVYKEYIN